MKKNIKKGKLTMTITMAMACFVLALVMSMQFKIVSQTDITAIENMRETELRTELANWKAKYEETEEKYQETIAKIEEYKQTKQSNEKTEKLVDAELEQVNMTLGKTDVEGEGIEIILRDTGNEEISKINAERIINMSDIVNINSTSSYDLFIKVNGQRILAPYVIKAIGNPTYLESALLGNGGYVDELKKIGHDISIEKPNKVEITKYNDEIKVKYME